MLEMYVSKDRRVSPQQPAATNYSLKDLLQTDGWNGANTTANKEIFYGTFDRHKQVNPAGIPTYKT